MSKWKRAGTEIAKAGATLLGGLLTGGPAGGIAAAASIAARALGVPEEPEAVIESLRTDPAATVKLREIESTERVRLAELAADRIREDAQTERTTVTETHQTFRVEASSTDEYVRRSRPWLLRVIGRTVAGQVAASFGLLAIGLAYNRSSEAMAVVASVNEAISGPLMVLCAAAGVYVHHRSTRDKPTEAGVEPAPGVLAGIVSAFNRRA